MIDRWTKLIVAAGATLLLSAFILGLAHSISTGFAGFWGGLPFWVISLFVLSLAAYDFLDESVRNFGRK